MCILKNGCVWIRDMHGTHQSGGMAEAVGENKIPQDSAWSSNKQGRGTRGVHEESG